jgi:hypothetical protein
MLRQTRLALLVALLPAGAQALTPISQQREVSIAIERETRVCPLNLQFPHCTTGPQTEITIENFSDSEAAPDLADFTATASVPGFAESSSDLVSTLGTSALTAEGSRTAWAPFGGGVDLPNGILTEIFEDHVTSSRYEVTFELTEATSYALEGTLEIYTNVYSAAADDASLSLTGPGGQVIASLDLLGERDCVPPEIDCTLSASLSETGVLAAGTYTLAAATHGRAKTLGHSPDSDSGSFALSLELSAPAVPLLPPAALPLLGAALLGIAARQGVTTIFPKKRRSSSRRTASMPRESGST